MTMRGKGGSIEEAEEKRRSSRNDGSVIKVYICITCNQPHCRNTPTCPPTANALIQVPGLRWNLLGLEYFQRRAVLFCNSTLCRGR